jgi:hypothetical protein
VFGLDALPFRIVAFITQALNLWLVGSIALRLFRSQVALVAAPLLWGLNAALATPLSWTSSYNQLLCATFLLGAFLLFLKYVETGNQRYYWWQCAVFVLGFGALEINVVYPALVFCYALLHDRRYLLSTLPLAALSLVYTLLHNHFSPKVQHGTYAMHFDAAMLDTFRRYWTSALAWPDSTVAWLITVVLLGFLIRRLAQRDWTALFPYLWFAIVIAPVLPLRDHFSSYYLTVPTVGLALAAAHAIHSAWMQGWSGRFGSLLITAVYLVGSLPLAREVLRFNLDRSKQVRDLVWSVQRAHELHPGKIILLQGVSDTAFWTGINDKPFRLLGIDDVWLAPGSENAIQNFAGLGDVLEFVFPPIATLRALDRGEAVVYDAASYPIRNITRTYRALAKASLKPEPALRIDAGHPHFADQIGPGWYDIETGYRWMSRRAVVWLGGPATANPRLRIVGYCPAGQVVRGPLRLAITVNAHAMPSIEIREPDSQFVYEQPLPRALVTAKRFEVVLEVDRTIPSSKAGRELGLAFGTFAVRP